MFSYKFRIWVLVIVLFIAGGTFAQPGLSFDLPKPKKFENRKLGSEKNVDKKFTLPRKFTQNTFSHYNYFFNATEKLKEVLARAKAGHKDDYSQLLSFYNYTLDETSTQRGELDSVIYKSTAGILLHDLRSNWVDNFYLLMGKAYYYRNALDSAYLSFQFLNYAFSPKEKDGYDKVIGSNSTEGGSAFSISTNEKRNLVKKVFSRPPSRNESLLWQIKTYLANKELAEATSLIQTLKYDPLFPDRLSTELNEVEAWYFYQQQLYDSAAFYLEKALPNANGTQERARWEFLIGQLYELSKQPRDAESFFYRANKHTIDPVLEVYSLLNAIRQNRSDEKAIQEAIDQLKKMARKDKYYNYRDIIYYTAAQMELDRKKTGEAKILLLRSIKTSLTNPIQKSKSFLALADEEFAEKNFVNARRYYDSVEASLFLQEERDLFTIKKEMLATIVKQEEIILRQDSLQKLALLPEADRNAFVKKLLKQLRKQQGLKEEEPVVINTGTDFNNSKAAIDIFAGNDTKGGDWYFVNNALKSRGFSEFRAKWGVRPNIDNWRRIEAIKRANTNGRNEGDGKPLTDITPAEEKPLSLETLSDNIPTSPEKLIRSNDSIMQACFQLGQSLQNGLEDYAAAITAYENLLTRFPTTGLEEKTLFNLYYCYSKTGDVQKAREVKAKLENKYGSGKLAAILKNPALAADSLHKKDGAGLYNQVYNLFIEGKFEEALSEKKKADSSFGKHYWSPQLLYIEAVYHIHQRNDSAATTVLNNIVNLNPGTPMAAKAQNLVDVLSRRQQIEDYLTQLEVQMPQADPAVVITDTSTLKNIKSATVAANPVKDNQQPVKAVAVEKQPGAKTSVDSLKVAKIASGTPSAYSLDMQSPHLVMLIMEKVDPVYVNEAKNAFVRYHREKYYAKYLEVTPNPLTADIQLLLFGKFDNAAAAIEYVEKTKRLAPSEIIPWMPAAKYSFVIITSSNLDILNGTKNMGDYKKFITQNYPGIFN
jgi:outer membrane protein assembly factor BamD (BamD/ComL family)